MSDLTFDQIPGYWTHQVPLVTAVLNTTGPVLELGCGHYSTALLHAICSHQKRQLLTAESELEWMNKFSDMKNDYHNFVHATDWDAITGEYDVVFIDHVTERRAVDLKRLRDTTKIFVVHDSEKKRWYKYGTYFDTFKYKYDYPRYTKMTTLLSDSVDVQKLFI